MRLLPVVLFGFVLFVCCYGTSDELDTQDTSTWPNVYNENVTFACGFEQCGSWYKQCRLALPLCECIQSWSLCLLDSHNYCIENYPFYYGTDGDEVWESTTYTHIVGILEDLVKPTCEALDCPDCSFLES